LQNTEERLAEMKKRVEDIQVPGDLEERLSRALAGRAIKRRRGPAWQARAAVLLVFFMLFGYHFNTLAYYGRTFLGFEPVMDGALQNLSQLGKGQILDLKHEFPDGRSITLEGIMLDGNQMIAFCSVRGPAGDLERHDLQVGPFMRSTFGRYLMQSGAGVINEDGTEMKYVFHFQPPRPWEKSMIIPFSSGSGAARAEGEFRFVLDRQKAMGFTLRVAVPEDFTVAEGKIRIQSLQASPTRTRVRGRIQGIMGLAADTLRGERFRPEKLDMQLLVNGEEWPLQGGSMTTDHWGITFERDFEALPAEIFSLQLRLASFQADHDVTLPVPLAVNQTPHNADLPGGHFLTIQAVIQHSGSTRVTLTTAAGLRLSRVKLLVDGEAVSLAETTDEALIKLETGKLLKTRTLHFHGAGDDLVLDIQRISVDTDYNQIISIPLE
jgi:hypothetical protein